MLILITIICWSIAFYLINSDQKDTIRAFQTTQRGGLVLMQGIVNIVRTMAPEGFVDYAVDMLKSRQLRDYISDEIRRKDTKGIVGYGNFLFFDDKSRLIFQNGDLPDKYYGKSAAEIYSEQMEKRGGSGFETVVGGIEKHTAGMAQYRFERGGPVKVVAWMPAKVSNQRTFTMLLYADRDKVFRRLGFYGRMWLTIGGTLLFNVIMIFVSMAYLRVVESQTRLEERARHLETINRLEERCKLLVESAGDGIVTFDEEGRIISVNQGALSIGGYSEEEIVGRKFVEFFKGPEKENATQHFARLLSEGRPVGYESLVVSRSGGEIPVSVGAASFTHEGRPLFQATIRDITLLKAREQERISNIKLRGEVEQLRELNALKTNFLSIVSHELRTPLAVIVGNVGLMLKDGGAGLTEELAKRLRTVQRRGRELKDLIDDLLNLASIEAGKLELNIETVSISDLFQDAAAAISDSAKAEKIAFESIIEPEDIKIVCDRLKLNRILGNLVKNAVNFTPAGGTIRMEAAARGGEVVFCVTDTGPGIPEAELVRVFERFYQVDSSLTRPGGGAGVGLSIAREMAELHGGWIRLRNVKPNGLCAEFAIPERPAAIGDSSRPTVVIVDRDPEFCSLLSHFLRENRFRAVFAQDSAAGIQLIESEKARIALIDSGASPMDGFAVCRAIRENPKTRGAYVIMLSALSEPSQVERAIEAGAGDCVTRPFEFNELLAKIRAIADAGK